MVPYHTCIIGGHRAEVTVELSPPLVGWLQPVGLEEVVQEREQHGIVVWQHEQIHR